MEMRRKLASNVKLAEAIIPKDFTVGCRRPTPGKGFLEALVTPNTTVHTDQMQRITEDGVISHDGTLYELDAIVCATGFDTSWIPQFPIKSRGKSLQHVWQEEGPMSYLGLGVPEFPNYYMFGGPVSVDPSHFSFQQRLVSRVDD